MSSVRGRKITLREFRFFVLAAFLLISIGCETTGTHQKSYNKVNTKKINNLAILYPVHLPEMTVSLRADEQFLTTLMTGPAIIPQIMLRLVFMSEKEEDTMVFNEMIFDLNIGETFCERLNTKLQLCSNFNVVPQEGITKNKVVWKMLEKDEKELEDYRKIATELGIGTVLEIKVLSYGIKDPGIFSGPYSLLKIGVKMTGASNGVVLWEEVIEARSEIDMGTVDFVENVYGDINHLKEELEKVMDIVTEECLERLSIDTHNTFLLDKDYRERKKIKIDIARKLNELNNLRYDELITDRDYKKKKRELIERAKGREVSYQEDIKLTPVKKESKKVIRKEIKTKSGLPPLPRRD